MQRIQVEITDEELNHLEFLMSQTGIKTKKELFNNAITLLEWAIQQRKSGNVIASLDKQGNLMRVLMPLLEKVSDKC